MNTKQKEKFFAFELQRCQTWQNPENLFESVKLAVQFGQLIPLENRKIEVEGGRRRARPVVEDIPSWFKQNYQVYEEWDEDKFDKFKPKERFAVSLRATLEPAWLVKKPIWDALSINLSTLAFGERYNYVSYHCLLEKDELAREDEVLTVFLQFARPVIEHLRPQYAAITDEDLSLPYGRQEIATQVKIVHWCNYFGPAYLQKYGEDIFLKAPGWRVEKWSEGIWYQLTEKFSDSKDKSLQEQVLAHFHSIGLEAVV